MISSLIKTQSGPLIQELAFDRSEYVFEFAIKREAHEHVIH